MIPFKTFDAALADLLQRLVDHLRAQLNLLTAQKADLEASVEQTTAELKVQTVSELQDQAVTRSREETISGAFCYC